MFKSSNKLWMICGLVWMASLVVFLLILYLLMIGVIDFSNTTLGTQLILFVFLLDILIGIIAFCWGGLSLISNFFNRRKTSQNAKNSLPVYFTYGSLIAWPILLFLLFLVGNKAVELQKVANSKVPTQMNELSSPESLKEVAEEKIVSPKPVVPSDPVITCKSSYPNCVGQSIQVKDSACSSVTCCQVGDKWSLYPSLDQCKTAQGTKSGGNAQTGSKKVQYTTTEAIINGTYYCYEDRVNELTRYETLIKAKQMLADSCNSNEQFKAKNCANNCPLSGDIASCVHSCYEGVSDKCPNSEVGNLRKEYSNKIPEICP